MSGNNIFSGNRLRLLFKQYLIHNGQFLLLSTGAYVGVIFITLSVTQVGNGLQPHEMDSFQSFLVVFVTLFGILYVGHSFPAFRSKESTIHYLMIPASVLEKFTFEFVSRMGITLLMIPVLYWITFHLQGYFFEIFTGSRFDPIGMQHLVKIEVPDDYLYLIYSLVAGGVLLALSLVFTGAAMFDKQPLVKSLFAVAVIVMFFTGYSYLIIEHAGVKDYHPPDEMMLVPLKEESALKIFAVALYVTTVVMLVVAFRKLKEREV